MSKVASAWCHLASSSHQAASNCGPRNCSGSSAEKQRPIAPFGHSSRRRDGIQSGRSPGGDDRKMPAGPSIMTSRASCSVSPTSAMWRCACSAYGPSPIASARTHSAPSRVLPAPRPASTSQVVQGLALAPNAGGSWCACASATKSRSSAATSLGLNAWSNSRVRPAGKERLNAARKRVTAGIDIGGKVVGCRHGVHPQGRSACAAICSGSR